MFRSAGEVVLPGIQQRRRKQPDSGEGERVDLKGESEPLYTPVFLRVFSRLHQERVVLKGLGRKEGHNSCRMLHEYGDSEI
jgi:hypothetical protein